MKPLPEILARILFTSLAVIAAFIVFAWISWTMADSRLKALDRMERPELREVFTAAVSDGTVNQPPSPATNFIVTSRHGGEPYLVRFKNPAGETTGFFVTRTTSAQPGNWQFKELVPNSPQIFYRARQTNR